MGQNALLKICPLFVGVLLTTASISATCNTAPIASDDLIVAYAEPVVVDVLANDRADGQAITVAVLGNTCAATASVGAFQLLELTPTQPIRSDCSLTYSVTDEHGSWDSATIQVRAATAIFTNGFESGDASAWSSCEPSCP